jgi:small subunit ribosomal protein S1
MGEESTILIEEEKEESPRSMDDLLEEGYDFDRPNRGDLLKGIVVRVSPEEILIDIGSKSEGVISNQELREAIKKVNVGDEVMVYVIKPEDRGGNAVLSLNLAELEMDWRRAEELFKNDEIFEGKVSDCNNGGLIVKIGKIKGFVPVSQLARKRRLSRKQMAKLIGSKIWLKVIDIDRSQNRLILSEQAAIPEWRRRQKERLLAELKEGDICHGRVSGLCEFGAFVDLGGADGLIHLSELSWKRVSRPSEVLRVGEDVEVYVLDVDRKEKRISLSLKKLQPDPWEKVSEKYFVGQLVEGTITKVAEFGAFARLKGEEIEGLIHVSEISNERVLHPGEVLKEGDVVTLRIIKIDRRRRRMALSLRRIARAEFADMDWRANYKVEPKEET